MPDCEEETLKTQRCPIEALPVDAAVATSIEAVDPAMPRFSLGSGRR